MILERDGVTKVKSGRFLIELLDKLKVSALTSFISGISLINDDVISIDLI